VSRSDGQAILARTPYDLNAGEICMAVGSRRADIRTFVDSADVLLILFTIQNTAVFSQK
jgi:hypothetical protein